MRLNRLALLASSAIAPLLIAPTIIRAQTKVDSARLARDFVQRFYDWYVPALNHSHSEPASDVVLREKKELLSDELYSALEDDRDAQAQVTGELVGIDYDPFTFAQDDMPPLVATDVKGLGDAYRVTVRMVCPDKPCGIVAIPEVKAIRGRWRIVNVHQSGADTYNLVSALEELAAERRKMSWDLERLGGWWRVVDARARMTNDAPAVVMSAQGRVTINPPTIDLLGFQDAPDSVRYNFTLDTLASPRRILMVDRASGSKWTGIYRISKDTLWLALPIEHRGDRPVPPAGFSSPNTLALILVRTRP